MDVGKSVGYVFEDQKWTNKLLIGAVVSVVPIVNFAFAGYWTEIMRNVSEQKPAPLPEWDNFGDKFMKGLFLFIAGLVYSLPALIVFCPFTFLPFLGRGGDDGNGLMGLFAGTTLLLTCLLVIYGLVISFLFPAINLNFARKGTFGSLFEFRNIWPIMSKNLGDYIVAWLITIVFAVAVSFVIGIVAGVLAFIPCCGWILAWLLLAASTVWIGTVYAHLFGQVGVEPPGQALVPGA
jgi:hypothetical protein